MANHNRTVEEIAFEVVREYEREHGRSQCIRVHKTGFDMVSNETGGYDNFRNIEVKSTAKKTFSWRHLEPKEWEQLNINDKFYLYVVTDVFNDPKVYVFTQKEILERFDRREIKFIFKFKKADFQEGWSKALEKTTN